MTGTWKKYNWTNKQFVCELIDPLISLFNYEQVDLGMARMYPPSVIGVCLAEKTIT